MSSTSFASQFRKALQLLDQHIKESDEVVKELGESAKFELKKCITEADKEDVDFENEIRKEYLDPKVSDQPFYFNPVSQDQSQLIKPEPILDLDKTVNLPSGSDSDIQMVDDPVQIEQRVEPELRQVIQVNTEDDFNEEHSVLSEPSFKSNTSSDRIIQSNQNEKEEIANISSQLSLSPTKDKARDLNYGSLDEIDPLQNDDLIGESIISNNELEHGSNDQLVSQQAISNDISRTLPLSGSVSQHHLSTSKYDIQPSNSLDEHCELSSFGSDLLLNLGSDMNDDITWLGSNPPLQPSSPIFLPPRPIDPQFLPRHSILSLAMGPAYLDPEPHVPVSVKNEVELSEESDPFVSIIYSDTTEEPLYQPLQEEYDPFEDEVRSIRRVEFDPSELPGIPLDEINSFDVPQTNIDVSVEVLRKYPLNPTDINEISYLSPHIDISVRDVINSSDLDFSSLSARNINLIKQSTPIKIFNEQKTDDEVGFSLSEIDQQSANKIHPSNEQVSSPPNEIDLMENSPQPSEMSLQLTPRPNLPTLFSLSEFDNLYDPGSDEGARLPSDAESVVVDWMGNLSDLHESFFEIKIDTNVNKEFLIPNSPKKPISTVKKSDIENKLNADQNVKAPIKNVKPKEVNINYQVNKHTLTTHQPHPTSLKKFKIINPVSSNLKAKSTANKTTLPAKSGTNKVKVVFPIKNTLPAHRNTPKTNPNSERNKIKVIREGEPRLKFPPPSKK